MEHPIVSERAPSRPRARYGVEACGFYVCVYVCVFIKLPITAQPDPVILVILCHSHRASQGGISYTYNENL